MNKQRTTEISLALGIFFTGLFTYLYTLAPTITFGDSGELVSMIHTLGVSHPTGFPLYILLGKVFSLLPIASIAFRVNVLSAACGALVPALLFLSFTTFFTREKDNLLKYTLAAAVALIFIFSYTLWSQAVMSRIYTLNAAFCAAALLLFINYEEKGQNPRDLYMWGFLSGLGAGLHLTFIAFSGLLWLYIIIKRFGEFKKQAGWIAFFITLGLSAYVYIFIRGGAAIALKWQPVDSISHFLAYISQQQYKAKMFGRDAAGYAGFFAYIKDVILRELSPLAFVLFLAGVVTAFFKKFKYTLLFILIYLSSILMLMVYGNNTDLQLAFRYLIPSYMIMMFFILLLFYYIHNFTKSRGNTFFVLSAFCIMMLALSFKSNSFEAGKRDNYTAYNYAGDVLASVPEKCGLFASGDNLIYPLAYYKFVLKKGPGVAIYDNIPTIFRDCLPILERSKSTETMQNVLQALSMGLKDLYTATQVGSKLFSEPASGLVYKISEKPAPDARYMLRQFPLKSLVSGPVIFHDYEEREVAGTYYLRLAEFYKSMARFPVYEYLLDKSVRTAYDSVPVLANAAIVYSFDPFIKEYNIIAEKLLLTAYNMNPQNFGLVFNLGSFYGRFNKPKQAAYYFELATKLDPYNYSVKAYLARALSDMQKQDDEIQKLKELSSHYDFGRDLIKENKFDEAMVEFSKDIELNPGLSRSYFHMGLCYSMKGEFTKAIPFYEKTLKADPNNTPALDNLGLVYIKLKKYKMAKDYFEKSLAIDPNQKRIKQDFDKLQKMVD